MPALDWAVFRSLPGGKSRNFEILCRGLMRLHYDRFGQFKALSNQPGVEFHIKLTKSCPLGHPPRWFGWQCKFHKLKQNGELYVASRNNIVSSLRTTESHLPGITDWILWTPYTLSKTDQDWFYGLTTNMNLHLWVEEEIDTYLSGDGLLLRSTYFGELILTPHNLEDQHQKAIKPIQKRWLEPVHQPVDAERMIRRMLGESGAWDQMTTIGRGLLEAANVITDGLNNTKAKLKKSVAPFITACKEFADTLLNFHEILTQGDLDVIQQKLVEQKTIIDKKVRSALRMLRTANHPVALDATNALDDMRIARELLEEAEDFLAVGLVAVLADAGGGKTQMAAQLTAPQNERPAGIFLHGHALHRGQNLNDLAKRFSINGNPLDSIEKLIAALDAAGKSNSCRLPVLIDGLNEAENPKDWKSALAILGEMVKKYPNVLVVCTLRTGEHKRDDEIFEPRPQVDARESFAIMALPDDVRRIESEGFGGDVHDAIDKYLTHFKINSEDAEIPVELLQHPLTLRIFCEVTNPERETEVIIDYFPASLSSLFEKYVANACERISQLVNLSYSYSADEVGTVIYKLGLEFWNAGKREIHEENFRELISDTPRPWDSSIINLLAQEGIIFRNPGREPGKFVIVPAYDALGGYIVSSALLDKNRNDTNFEWLKKLEVMASFFGENSHELASNIFISLVTLTPARMHGRQLWKEVPDPYRNTALLYTTRLEANHLDEDTLAGLSALLSGNPKARNHLFLRLKETKGATKNPLNAQFLDTTLRKMTVSVRDLSWTEWIRETRRERFNELLAIEEGWKDKLSVRTPSDRLRAKWVMWHLSSTDRELRDIATRALYWYGRGDPIGLFEESVKSLEINDPYIPERMLAASYGVAMAKHVDLNDREFGNTVLPDYAQHIFDMIFKIGAPFSTTHILMREYACKTIELASLRNPQLFSEDELKRTKPPFTCGGLRDWGESDALEDRHGRGDSPFRMDFENYTIGSLVPGRGNYDYTHEEYRKVRAQILWRIEQLGWTSDQFGKVDRLIAADHPFQRIGGDAKKTERYGKKYSWIAYFEMSGLLCDTGVLENWGERTSSVDIDPSFPERVANERIIDTDFLGDPSKSTRGWVANAPSPDVTPFLHLHELQSEQGPWVALDGFFAQEDKQRGRRIFCFVRSFLVAPKDATSIIEYLSCQDMGGRWLPEKPSVIYTFAGEIPWCETFLENGMSELAFVVNEKTVKVQKTQPEIYLERTIAGNAFYRVRVREDLVEVEEVQKEYVKFKVMIPVCDFGWESYHTVASDAGRARTLAKEIALSLEIIGQPQTFDMFSLDGKRVTRSISDQRSDFGNGQSMFFIREDLLKTYLAKNDLSLIWAIWGERQTLYSSDRIDDIAHDSEESGKPYAVYSYIKRYE